MKKILFSLMALMAVSLVSFTFTSCGDDDDSDKYGGSGSSGIVGTWVDGSTTMTLGSDGSYNLKDTSVPSHTQYRRGTYTYNPYSTLLTVNVVAVDGENSAYQQTYIVQTLNETTLVLLYMDGDVEGYYTRQ